MKPCVILNPRAGKAQDIEAIRKELAQLQPAVVHTTKKAGDAAVFAGKAVRAKCKYLIAAGVDGTLNEVINGVARHVNEVRVGLLPLGTGNDFARSLKLPTTIAENIAILRAGKKRQVDLVRVRSDRIVYFVNVSAGGFSGLVDEKLTPEIKRTWGPLAYVRSAAAALPDLHAYRTTIVLDGTERFSIDLYNVIIANGRFVAAGLPIAPNADPSDGLLDLVLIPNLPKPDMALLATQMVLGKHLSSNALIFRRAKKISVRSRPGMWFNVDGEAVGNEPAVFQVVPRALNFVVSKR